MGDKDHQVIAECFSSLMQINPERSMEYIEKFLNSRDLIIAENAAFALGESRLEDAFEILRRHREPFNSPLEPSKMLKRCRYGYIRSEFQNMLLMPMAITRLEMAFEYLIDITVNGSQDSAVAAVKAIEIFSDEHHLSKIDYAVVSRNDVKIFEAYKNLNRFDTPL